jgi:mono/diheme cytochrome c family protein
MSDPSSQHQESPEENQEVLFSIRNIILAMLVLVVMIGLVQLVSFGLSRVAQAPPQIFRTITPPAPRLQANPPQELQELKATQLAQIETYGWIDRQSGVVHIPIDKAMELYIERARGGGTPQPTSTQGPEGSPSAVQRGEMLFQELGCAGCHTGQENAVGPQLQGLFGEQVNLGSGETVVAEESYIRESILNPSAKVVAGYQPIMPSFQDRVSEEDLSDLVAYIESLKKE